MLMNISEFEDISKATDTMISALQAFKTEGVDVADLSMEIIDAYNEVGNNYAISTSDLADSLTRSSASLVAAGNSLSEAIALTTASNTIIQNPESVGTTLKTLSMRLRGTSVDEIVEAGEETDGLISSTSKLAAKVQELTSIDGEGGVKILTDTGAYKSTYQILLEIARVWEDMNDMDQAALLEIIAGKRAGSAVAAILQDADLLENVFDSAENSSGSAITELQAHLDSIGGKIEQLTNSIQIFWNNFLNDEIVKSVIDLVNWLIKLADTWGALPTAMGLYTFVDKMRDIKLNTTQVKTDAKEQADRQSLYRGIVNAIRQGLGLETKSVPTGSETKAPTAQTNHAINTTSAGIGATVKDINKQTEATQKLAETTDELNDIRENSRDVQQKEIDTTKGVAVVTGELGDKQGSTNEAVKQGTAAILKDKAVKIGSIAVDFAKKAALAAVQGAVMALVGVLINKAISAWQAHAQAMKDAKTEAINTADSFEENRKAVSEYAEEVKELRAEIANNTTTEQEAYDARMRILEIQDDLISKYGKEAEGINLVTGALKEQFAAIEALDQQNAADYVTRYAAQFADAKKNLDKKVNSNFTLTNQMLEDEAVYNEFAQFLTDKGFEQSLSIGDRTEGSVYGHTFQISADKQELASLYDAITEWMRGRSDIDLLRKQISIEMDRLNFEDADYLQDKAVYDDYVEQKALADYTNHYKAILDAKGVYKEAKLTGTPEMRAEAVEGYRKALSDGLTVATSRGEQYMMDYFQGQIDALDVELKQADLIDAINTKGSKSSKMAARVKNAVMESDLYKSDLVEMARLSESGELDDSGYGQNVIAAFKEIEQVASEMGLTIQEAIDVLTDLGYIKLSPDAVELTNVGKSIDMLSSKMEDYKNVMDIMSDITYKNLQISEEHYTALAEYIGDNAELQQAVNTENGEYIITNTELLKDLIKQKQKEQATDVKLSRAQARLRYYDMYKQMRQLTNNGQKKLTGAALDTIEALYEQMNSIEKTIAKYSLLESKLLGVASAFDQLEVAQAADEELDYGSKAETMVNVLAEAFNTAELGSEAAQVAIAGLIPEDVIDKTKTLDEQMEQIYKYFTKGAMSQLFTIEFDDNGGISSVEMKKEDIEETVNSLLKTALPEGMGDGTIFQGTWDEFTLNPAIDSLEEFAKACNITEEVAFSFLTSLEKYDIGWLGGDNSTLLDQLMGDDIDYQLYDKMQKIADLEMKIAKGTITSGEQSTYGTLIGDMETLEEQALSNSVKWAQTTAALEETKQEMVSLNKELAETENADDRLKIQDKIEEASEKANKLVTDLGEIREAGGEPTEFTLQVSADEAQEQIDDFKQQLNELAEGGDTQAIAIRGVVQQIDSKGLEELGLSYVNGTWQGLANITGYSKLDPVSQQSVIDYLNLINQQHTIDTAMGSGIITVEQHLERIVDILDKTYDLMVEAKVDDTEVETFADKLSKPWKKAVRLFFEGSSVSSGINSISGGGGDGMASLHGTAHARGTAYKGGNWGAPKTEEALVGELGAEMRVRGNRWELIGQNGAEFTDVRKGDIIFNHRQTKELLKNGHISGRGKAYVNGTSGTAYLHALDAGVGGYRGGIRRTAAEDAAELQREAAIRNQQAAQMQQEAALREQENQASWASWNAAASVNTFDDHFGTVGKDYGNVGSGSGKDETEELIDFIEMKLEEIEQTISKTSAELTNLVDDTTAADKKDDLYDKLVNQEKLKEDTYTKAIDIYNQKAQEFFKKIPEKYQAMAKNGALAIEDFVGENEAKHAEAINSYREWANKASDAEVGALEAIAQQAQYRLEQFNDNADDYDNRGSLIESENSLIEAQIDLIEESGERLSANYYVALRNNTEAIKSNLEAKRDQMKADRDAAMAAGDIEKGTDEWFEMQNAIDEVSAEIMQCQVDIEGFQNSINDLKWDNLEKLIDRFDALDSELSHLFDRLSDNDDVVDEFGNWTDKGIAAMGVAAQQMEVAQYKAQEYGKAIADLKANKESMKLSEDEYNEKLAELTENQWESIEAYESAKDALVDLNKTRIDAVKEAMQKEIDAYKELIDKQKEALDAEKDLYDFEKNIAEQEEDIAKLERKIAALSADNSASAAAQRKQLEAELLEAKANLEDTYYDRSVQNQQTALDKEYENYEETMNDEMEALDKWLKDEEAVIKESLDTVKANTEVVWGEIDAISKQYGIQVSESITQPWKDGSNAISGYKDSFVELSDTFAQKLNDIIALQQQLQLEAEKTAQSMVNTAKNTSTREEPAVNQPKQPANNNPAKTEEPKKEEPKNTTITKGQTVRVDENATHFSDKSGNKHMASFVPGSSYEVHQTSGNQVLLKQDDVYIGWVNKEDLDLEGYAKGTTGVKNSQWAWIDEMGEELVLHAGSDGKLAYLTKGSAVVPHDLTNKLMDLVADPTQTLENSRPIISAPHITNNEINVNMEFGSVVNIEHVDNDTVPNLTKAVEKQMDKYLKSLNANIRKYVR